MPTSMRRSALHVVPVLIMMCAMTACADAQTPAAASTATTNSQSAAPAAENSAEQRIKDLEERLIALEGQVRMLKQQAAAAAPAAAASTAGTQTAGTQTAGTQAAAAGTAPESTSQAAAQAQNEPAAATPPDQGASIGGATGMAKALNPDIALIGNFIASAGHNSVAGIPSMEMHESELSGQAVVDPYARADFFISFG